MKPAVRRVLLSSRRRYPVSGSVRCHVPTVTATASGSLCFVFRSGDYSNAVCTNPVVQVWNGYCLGNGTHGVAAESLTGFPLQVRYGLLTGGPGTTAANQSAATVWKATFFGMLTDAAFVAAGGTVSADGLTVTIPDGKVASTDPIVGLTLPVQTRYFHQIEEVYQTNQLRITGDNGTGATHGDMRWTQISATSSPVYSTDWSIAYNGTTPSTIAGSSKWPLAVIGTGNGSAQAKIVCVEGDSINSGVNGYLGTWGERSPIKTALINAGYNYVSPAASGTNISDMKDFGGFAVRMSLVKGAYAVLTDHLHNDRGSVAVPAGAFASTALPYVQWHNQQLRANAQPGARISRSTLLPHTNTTDAWATLANQTQQTAADGTSNWVATYSDYVMRRGTFAGVPFNPANDPDAGWDHFASIGASVADYKWPVTGAANFATPDGTHPSQAVSNLTVSFVQPLLSGLIGF